MVKTNRATIPSEVINFSDSAGFETNWHSVFRPGDMAQLVNYLRHRSATGGAQPPLYPVSVGYNWGLGSKVAPVPGCILVELAELRAVRYIDTTQGYAVIEPGVTQAELAGKLKGSSFLLNCTMSSAESSIVGNVLERGMGCRRSRGEDLLGLEVLLANGETLTTGFMPSGDRRTASKHGLGPSTLELFCQSNLGIVTAATIALIPRAEAIYCVKITAPKTAFQALVTTLRYCQLQGLVTGIIKIYDTQAFHFYSATNTACYHAYVFLEGPAELLKITVAFVQQRVTATIDNCIVEVCNPLIACTDNPAELALFSSFCGDPSLNDVMIQNIFGVAATQVDTTLSRCGWLFFLPLVPSCVDELTRAVSMIEEVASTSGLQIGYTLNLLATAYTDLVISIRFDRLTECSVAHATLSRLHHAFAQAGYVPYRLDIGNMDTTKKASGNHVNHVLMRGIKDLLDPHRQFSPGRYEWQ